MPKKRNAEPARDAHDFRSRLRDCVDKAGGQVRVEELSGIPRGTLAGHLEKTEPQRPSLITLARVFGVNIAWLAAGIGPRDVAASPTSGIDSFGWITVNEFKRCDTSDGKLVMTTGQPIIKISPAMAGRAFPGVTDPTKLVAFCAMDSFMDPDILENEYLVCSYSDSVIPDQLNGILGIVENNQVYARYVAKVSLDELMISHRKTAAVDPMRVPISEVGRKVFILGRVLLSGSYVGNRHRDWIPRIESVPGVQSSIVIIRFDPRLAEQVETGLSDLGIAATYDPRNQQIMTAFADDKSLSRIPLIPGVVSFEHHPAPTHKRTAA